MIALPYVDMPVIISRKFMGIKQKFKGNLWDACPYKVSVGEG